MRISLRLRLLSLIAVINVAVFSAGIFYLSDLVTARQIVQERKNREYAENLVFQTEGSISPEGELRVAQMLEWPMWGNVEDAILIDANPGGVSLNPRGAVQRATTFDYARIERDLRRAIEESRRIPTAGGFAVPIRDNRQNRTWGGCWFTLSALDSEVDQVPFWRKLLPWFFASTLLLFLGTYSVLRRYVLKPVGMLASGARRMQEGELDVRLDSPAQRDEMADLITSFNSMATEVGKFHEHLEDEVQEARKKAYQAEAAAMRQRRLAAMGELAAGIAHEINNPLGGMLNAVDVLDRPETDAKKRVRYHELLRGGLQRIQGTVAGLLRFTPRSNQAAHQEFERLDLRDPVRDALELVRHRAEKRSIEVVQRSVGKSERDFEVMGARSELGQVILNLLVNSLDALEEGKLRDESVRGERSPRIQVELSRTQDDVCLVVIDDGPGVDSEHLERVADLFYTTKEVGRGTGLGLALVHNVIDAHGGRVQLSNEAGGGFRVELFLPAAPVEGGSGR